MKKILHSYMYVVHAFLRSSMSLFTFAETLLVFHLRTLGTSKLVVASQEFSRCELMDTGHDGTFPGGRVVP